MERRAVAWPDNIVWLASYPRSGNTYLRAILWTCFGVQTGSIYPDDFLGNSDVAQRVGHFEGAAHGQFSAEFLRLPLVKTHEWPADNRKAIYIVRNGRDCCRSLREFLRASGHHVDLDAIIDGQHYFGSWSGHFLAWDPVARPNTLFLRFEQLTKDVDGTLERLASFLDMRPLHAVPPKLMAACGAGPHWLSPGSTRGEPMTRAQEALFDGLHGHVMARLGYPTAPSQPKAVGRASAGALVARIKTGFGASSEETSAVMLARPHVQHRGGGEQTSSFPLFTSIRPPAGDLELFRLRECLDSWHAAGFDAISVNGPAETEQLRGLDLPVVFHANVANGKPRIGAILDAIRESGARLASIINSDCEIVNYPGLVANLKAHMEGTVVLAWRVDLGSDLNPTAQRGGFDAFFFDTKVIPRDDCGFSIAEPWWDHWFPIACEMGGAKLETLAVPLLTHLAHPERWSDETYVHAGHRFWAELQNWHCRGDMPESFLSEMPADLRFDCVPSKQQLSDLAATTPVWLNKYRPQTISVMGPQASGVERMLRFGGRAIVEKGNISGLRAEIANLRNSVSWRITAPLRRMGDVLRNGAREGKGRVRRTKDVC